MPPVVCAVAAAIRVAAAAQKAEAAIAGLVKKQCFEADLFLVRVFRVSAQRVSIPVVGGAGQHGMQAVDLLQQHHQGQLMLHGVAA